MAEKINTVLEGQFKNKPIRGYNGCYVVTGRGFNKRTVKNYTIIDENNKNQYSIWKGILGVTLLGSIGAVAGIGGKKKKEYIIAIEWTQGEKSLIYIDDETYKEFLKGMF